MLKDKNKEMIFKLFLVPIILYCLVSVLCVYVFENSNISTQYLNLDPRISKNIAGFIIMAGLAIIWRVIMSRYTKITGNTLSKRHFLYWKCYVAIFLIGSLLALGSLLIIMKKT